MIRVPTASLVGAKPPNQTDPICCVMLFYFVLNAPVYSVIDIDVLVVCFACKFRDCVGKVLFHTFFLCVFSH